jgi:hypothetical protein
VQPVAHLDRDGAGVVGREVVAIDEPGLDDVDAAVAQPGRAFQRERDRRPPPGRDHLDRLLLDGQQRFRTARTRPADEQLDPHQAAFGATEVLHAGGDGGGSIHDRHGVGQREVGDGEVIEVGIAADQLDRWRSVRNVTCRRGYARGERARMSATSARAGVMSAAVWATFNV